MSMKQTLFSNNNKPKTPKSPSSPTIRQLLQGIKPKATAERTTNYLSNRNVSPKLGKDLQQDEDRYSFQPIKKLSVLAKVKEKARKWRQNLARKKQGQDSDSSPAWGVAYEDYEKDEDPRRFGTPTKMYALRRSSTSYKEGMRPRSMSGLSITEKHVLSCSVDRGYSEHCERVMQKATLSPSKSFNSVGSEMRGLVPIQRTTSEPTREHYRDPSPEIKITPLEDDEEENPIQDPKVKLLTSPPKSANEGNVESFVPQETVQDAKLSRLVSQKSIEKDAKISPLASQTIEKDTTLASQTSIEASEDPTEDLNPTYMKLIVEEIGKAPNPSPEEGAFEQEKQEIDPPTERKNLAEAVTEKLAPASANISEETQSITSEEQEVTFPKPLRITTTRKEATTASVVVDDYQDYEENGISGDRKWDKGVSVKEYIKNKLEPGEDERALSQVISEAISPRRTPGDKGVMEKVKEAVTLLLLAEQKQLEREQEVKLLQQKKQQEQLQQQEQQRPSSVRQPSLSQIPVSTYPYEDDLNVEDESHGRILRAN